MFEGEVRQDRHAEGFLIHVPVVAFLKAAQIPGCTSSKEKRTVAIPEQPRVMDYSPERKRLYVGTLTTELDPPRDGSGEETRPADTIGRLYVLDWDAEYLPVGPARLFASQVGGGFHDGLGVDACGNLLVADYQTSGLYRVTPEGEVALYHPWDMQTYGHSLSWGSGGWDDHSLYLPQPYNDDTIVKVDVGVPARPRD